MRSDVNNVAIDTEVIVQKAVGYFKQSYNCSQSVALAFADYYGIPEPLMARFSASFGGGIGRMRETCGSACAMFMLAGLEVQNVQDAPCELDFCTNPYPSQELKKTNYEVVQRLAEQFRAQTGSICCRELLGLNKQRAEGSLPEISATPEARTDEYYKKRPCVRMVETAVRVYCAYLNEKQSFAKDETSVTATSFRSNIKHYMDLVIKDSQEVIINRGDEAAVLVPMDMYNAIKETEYLMASKEMERAILTGMEDVKKGNFVEVDIDEL